MQVFCPNPHPPGAPKTINAWWKHILLGKLIHILTNDKQRTTIRITDIAYFRLSDLTEEDLDNEGLPSH
jgi:hypothetical protein